MTPHDLEIVAKTCWGEARGEGRKGMQAVAEVILNRAKDTRWPRTPADVAQQKWQFSAWNAGDPNRVKMEHMSLDDDGLRLAYRAVLDAMEGANITFGANHYFAPGSIATPKWAKDMEIVAEIGRHRFFRG